MERGGSLPERQRQKCQLIERTPFEVKAIQVDGGRAGFANAAGGGRQVERAHRSHVQAFYDYYVGELSMRAWEGGRRPHTLRPHRAELPKATARSATPFGGAGEAGRPSTRTGCRLSQMS